jgi:hypothetical protein
MAFPVNGPVVCSKNLPASLGTGSSFVGNAFRHNDTRKALANELKKYRDDKVAKTRESNRQLIP